VSDSQGDNRWSASCLLYLFGGEVLPHPHFSLSHLFTTEHAVHLPCHGGSVTLGPLEAHVFAWAFWQLHDAGAVELELAVPAASRRKRDDWLGLDVSVRRLNSEAAVPGVLAEELYALCTEDPVLLSSVIVAWGKGKGVNAKRIAFLPLTAIVDLIHLDACVYLGMEPARPDRSRIDCDTVASLRPLFDLERQGWGTFVDNDTDLATALVRCCDAGLSRLRPPKIAAVIT
jgi:hypothetical protein